MLFQHLHRHDMEDSQYQDLLDSLSVAEYGKQRMSQPGPRSGIERRTFHDLRPETIKERRDEVKYKIS